MASVVNTYKVHYHFEQAGKKASPEYIDYVQASASDYATIKGVLSSNSRLRGNNTTLAIDSIQEVGHGDSCIA